MARLPPGLVAPMLGRSGAQVSCEREAADGKPGVTVFLVNATSSSA